MNRSSKLLVPVLIFLTAISSLVTFSIVFQQHSVLDTLILILGTIWVVYGLTAGCSVLGIMLGTYLSFKESSPNKRALYLFAISLNILALGLISALMSAVYLFISIWS